MDDCLTNNTVWPPTGDNAKGQPIRILAAYRFRSAIAMFWPGAGKGTRFGSINLNASSQGVIQF